MKRVYSCWNVAEASLVRNLLEGQGIATDMSNEFLASLRPEIPAPDAWPTVWVLDDDDAPLAEEIVAEYVAAPEPSQATHWRCPSCREMHEPQFGTCWRCGVSR